MANPNPTVEELNAKLPELREQFKTKFSDQFTKYDQRDIDRLNSDDAYARTFLNHQKLPLEYMEKTVDDIDKSLVFRKEWEVNDLNEASFANSGLIEKNGLYYKGHDKDNHPILYFSVKLNQAKTAEEVLTMKKFIAWHIEQQSRKNPGERCVCLMDMSGASTSNVNIDITKFIIACFTTYFPSYLAYLLNYEMPLLVTGVWKIISAFLNADQKKKVLVVKKKDLKNYIPEAGTWWEHMTEK